MFITSFGEQNITYKCCSNFLIHLLSRIYKNAISLDDKQTSALIFNLRDDGKITLSEYNEIVESYKSYSNSAFLDQSISKAEQREREFMKRKYQTQENAASFPLAK